jgi:hypothetical protein
MMIRRAVILRPFLPEPDHAAIAKRCPSFRVGLLSRIRALPHRSIERAAPLPRVQTRPVLSNSREMVKYDIYFRLLAPAFCLGFASFWI